VENSEGNRPTLPLRFGGDQRTVVGRIEFASFAMLAMPGHEAVPRLLPDKEMSPIFRVGSTRGGQFIARSYF
jgi:hypothetical protein